MVCKARVDLVWVLRRFVERIKFCVVNILSLGHIWSQADPSAVPLQAPPLWSVTQSVTWP